MEPIPYDHALAPLLVRNRLFAVIPPAASSVTVLCIGSNRVNGDSLGPFVGTLLQGLYPAHLRVLGSLREPVDALHIEAVLAGLSMPPGGCLLAVDSVVGAAEDCHHIFVRPGPLQPGTGIGQQLPSAGDVSIMGVVMSETEDVRRTLPYTNLHVVYEMARAIAAGISLTVRQRFHYSTHSPLLLG